MTNPTPEFYRFDPLTGCNNFLSFVETLDQLAAAEERIAFSILYFGMNYMGRLNETNGYAYGDSVLRWLSIVLQEESHAPAYRIGWDNFALILTKGVYTEDEALLNRIFARLNTEGKQL